MEQTAKRSPFYGFETDRPEGRARLIKLAILESDPSMIETWRLTRDTRWEIKGGKIERELSEKDRAYPGLDYQERVVSELYTLFREWRHYPYGIWIESSNSIVVFDRSYCPIVRLHLDRPPEIVPPLERIEWVVVRWFYDDSTSPGVDPDTFERIHVYAVLFGVIGEIRYRSRLSDYGRLARETWGSSWERQ